MTSGVPIWATILLAVIAVLGSIGGGLVGAITTARRDDKRWSQEEKRADDNYWRDRRIAAYVDFINGLGDVIDRVGNVRASLEGSGISLYDDLKSLGLVYDKIPLLETLVEVVCPHRTRMLALQTRASAGEMCVAFQDAAIRRRCEGNEWSRGEDVTNAVALLEKFREDFDKFIEHVRVEFNVDPLTRKTGG